MTPLLARFLADPTVGDAELPVLADAMTEAGDPRGELIALQLAPPTPATARAIARIVKAHRAHLVGALAPVLAPEVTFRRGFLARARLAKPPGRTLGDPLWATVEHLEGEPVTSALVEHPIMRSLRSLARVAIPTAKLATYPWLEALGIHLFEDGAHFAKRGAFPALRALDVHLAYARASDVDVRELLRHPILKRLARLSLDVAIGADDLGTPGLADDDLATVGGWLEQLAALAIADVELVTRQGKATTRYRFTPGAAHVAIPRFPAHDGAALRASVDDLVARLRGLRATVDVTRT